LTRSYSSGVRPCSATMPGVIFGSAVIGRRLPGGGGKNPLVVPPENEMD
jgi:hypothetical protein